MLAFLLPLASKIVDAAIAKIPDDAELGEKLIEICLSKSLRRSKGKSFFSLKFLLDPGLSKLTPKI